ncbi:hypothetical protein B2K_19290 [Paenibacillus mucilaginosus K02]|uniref:Uncharacterized protein n=1 Tax=Paenibacillus mucilaginosus K02 TaxID=997761 RepID=I0BKD6_9BACL|nr:hypothetical protein B2K_19290 [Paenibacillus mucilaginosus K02]
MLKLESELMLYRGGRIVEFIFIFLPAFLFMMCFLITIRVFINKDTGLGTLLTFVTSGIFGVLFWLCIMSVEG